MRLKIVEQRAMRLFSVVFVIGILLTSISSVALFPFNQILFATGFSSMGFGFGLLGTLSIMREYEPCSKNSS